EFYKIFMMTEPPILVFSLPYSYNLAVLICAENVRKRETNHFRQFLAFAREGRRLLCRSSAAGEAQKRTLHNNAEYRSKQRRNP
ncbi:MAG: hypothetical protein ABIK42_04070, partial [candidate division WOR-3 bacterium]